MRAYLLFAVGALVLLAQTDAGDLRVRVRDVTGLPLPGSIRLTSEASHYRRDFTAGADGYAEAKSLPYGVYRISVQQEGFSPFSELVEIRSAIPRDLEAVLGVAPLETAVNITDSDTLVDPHRTGAVERVGAEAIEYRRTAPPGRSLADLVTTEPGWLVEANGVLHPRGSEYQVQYVKDGIPLTDNRSPAFAAGPDADGVQSMSILTAGYPAEFGRKLGGVVEMVTARDSRPGFHGKAVAFGGSFATGGGYAEGQYGWHRNTLTVSGAGSGTDRFLDPPVEENYTNHGSTGDTTAQFERDWSDSDRMGVVFSREQSKFLVPDERAQQAAGQRQDRRNFETSGQVYYTHIFSSSVLADVRGMVRDVWADLWSNPFSTPMRAAQDRGFREGYLKGSVSAHFGAHEVKGGFEGDFARVYETLDYRIDNPARFDPATPAAFHFDGRAPDREEALFLEDEARIGNFTFSAGLRYDRYRLLVDQGAWSPRLGAAWYWPATGVVFRLSYDRVFQTPAIENLLVASSPEAITLSPQVLRLPVEPSRGNFYEAGFAKAVAGHLRLEGNFYRRDLGNFADDDLLLNTGVSFPITFRKARIQGAEAKVEIPRWGPLSGYLSYSNMRGTGYLPVTGGLLLGAEAAGAAAAGGSFPISQDQRNTASSRFRYGMGKRAWVALGGSYGSGLPVEFEGTAQEAVAEYGQRIVNRVNFTRGRVRPGFTLDASAGTVLWKRDRSSARIQVDMLNLTNKLNVINFAGLFSGTALGAPRSASARLEVEF